MKVKFWIKLINGSGYSQIKEYSDDETFMHLNAELKLWRLGAVSDSGWEKVKDND